ncbi:MAG: hypothetical protein ACYDAD_03140 [Acidimicrobiales bacterium]
MSHLLPAVALGGLLLAGCGHATTPRTVPLPGGGRADGGALTAAVSGLCDAASQARHDPATAGSTFYLRSHTELHTLAAALGVADRSRSARLLEAMYAVEQDIAASPARPGLGADLAALTAQAGGDLAVLHLSTPSCTRRTKP